MSQHDRPWRVNDGRKPRAPGETLCEIEFANGRLSRQPYQIQQLTWELDRGEFSIAKYRRAERT